MMVILFKNQAVMAPKLIPAIKPVIAPIERMVPIDQSAAVEVDPIKMIPIATPHPNILASIQLLALVV